MFDSESSTTSNPSSSRNSEFNAREMSTEKSHELDSLMTEYSRKWIDALKKYLTETQASSLDLSHSKLHLKLGVEEARSVFRILPNSQVTELNLDGNELGSKMEAFLQMLLRTKISKLEIHGCEMYHEGVMRLIAVLKDTHVTELHMRNNGVIELDMDKGNEFLSHLVESRLTRLDFDFGFCDPGHESDDPSVPYNSLPYVTRFIQVIPTTTITDLSLSQIICCEDTLSSLFRNLCHTRLIHLSLNDAGLKAKNVKELSLYLRDSKLESLDLSNNNIEDAGIEALAIGLVCSKISTLNISETFFTGSNSFGVCLKNSQITTLDVSHNSINSYILLSFPGFLRFSSLNTLDINHSELGDKQGQKLMRSLQFSKITNLNVASNNLQLLTALEFADIVKDTELTDVDFSHNCFPFDGIVALGNCLRDSKLRHINLRKNQTSQNINTDPVAYSIFLEKTKASSLKSINFRSIGLNIDGAKKIANSLVNTTFTYLDLAESMIGNDFVAPLKFTAITHLNLSYCGLNNASGESVAKCMSGTKITHLNLNSNSLGDAGTKAIAKILKQTRIIELKLYGNNISTWGALALAFYLKNVNLLYLDLSSNNIENDGLEALVQSAEGTFITRLDLRHNPATCKEGVERLLLIDTVLLENKTSVHHLLNFFKRIAPDETSPSDFRLDEGVCNANVDMFLEECLIFYKTVVEQPSAISVLVNDESFSFSWEEVVLLLREEFPRQFATFVINSLEATVTEHVVFLKRVEELGLSKIVEFLLLNRPALMIDENEGILHPYVYKMLHKYRQPLYSSVEPEGKYKIIKYFSKHSELEGAAEIINLLQIDQKL